MRNEGSEVKKISKINLAGKKGKMVAGENGLKNGPIENGLIQWSRGQPLLLFQLNPTFSPHYNALIILAMTRAFRRYPICRGPLDHIE
jgi:hypothetical protein